VLGKHTLNVGEKTKLEVSYATEGRPGLFEKEVTFTTNLPDEEKIEIFHMKGIVKEAPSAKISVEPRRVVLEGSERDTGKKQTFAITNDGTLPLEITRIAFKDGSKVFFDSAESGKLVIGPGTTQDLDLDLDPESGSEQVQKLILIECNARNAGSTGYFLIVRYEKR
jgi:hypothetical protein